MIEVGAPDIIERAISSWHKKRGFIFAVLFVYGLASLTIGYFDKNEQLVKCYFYSFVIILLIVSLLWLLTTNRIIFRNNNDLVIAIMILVDEEDETKSLYQISKRIIKKMKASSELSSVKLVFMPTNFMESLGEVKKHVNRNSNSLDMFLILHVKSGNIQNDHKTEINHLEFVYNLNNLPYEGSVLLEKINFISEIKFQNFHKKWVILNSNSFEDRALLKTNFEDMLYHAIAIQYIFIEKYERSLSILGKILQTEKLNIKIDSNNTQNLKVQPEFISQARILHLLSTLYLSVSDKYMYSNPEKTLHFLQSLEKITSTHKYSFLQFLIMARMYYECGDLNMAVLYTNKAEKFNDKEPSIQMNRAFFGILQKDWDIIITNLKIVFHKRKKIVNGIIPVVEFLVKEHKKYPKSAIEFNFVISFYETLFLDGSDGKKRLESLLPILENNNVPTKAVFFAKKIIDLA